VNAQADSLPADVDWDAAFGTTALCAVDTPGEIRLGYVGNGAIFHVRANFNTFPSSQLLPWTAVNYLNPHSAPQQGKNVLYQIVAPRATGHVLPTVVTVGKDSERLGDIVMVCTDGIYSYDQTPMGRDGDGNIWISGEATMALFFEALSRFFAGGSHTDDDLRLALEDYLKEVETKGLATDDCTVGVIVTERALTYQRALRNRRLEGFVSA
jgi:hypothetical protein